MKAHPLTKILIVCVITSCSLLYRNPVVLSAFLVLSFILNVISAHNKDGWQRLLKQVYRLYPVIISIFILQVLFNTSGTVLFNYRFIKVTDVGFFTAVQVVLRLLIIIFSAGYLFKLGLRDYLSAFRILKLPEALAVIVAITIGFIPLLSAQISQSRQQIKLRGIEIGKLGMITRAELYLSLLMPVIGKAVSNAKYQAITLELRGFRNGKLHTDYQRKALGSIDIILIMLCGLFILWLVV